MKRILIQFQYNHNSTATLFGQGLGVQGCNFIFDDKGSRFGNLRELVLNLRRLCADLVKVDSFGTFDSEKDFSKLYLYSKY